MASTTSIPTDGMPTELGLLESLVRLYDREIELYGDILKLSHKQRQYITEKKPLVEIRALLKEKNDLLDTIARLEAVNERAKTVWQRKKHVLIGEMPVKLQERFTRVAEMIEEILKIEAVNDHLFISAANES